ncbi:5772_t:CDS:2 [Acaulospora morrowiae]|uniref:5772_t:CDS:1 n=1 Tax=Acaulospora morrowiae TaxID=94023 RepID=A0A9N9B858_9GLOM|nr:5772_t:CDS:2 [Acaulospora morrowiae]
MEQTNAALSFNNDSPNGHYKLDQIHSDLVTISPPGTLDKNKKSIKLVIHSEENESLTNPSPSPSTPPLTSYSEDIKSPDLVNNIPTSSVKSLTTFINTPKYIRQYLSDTFKADGFGQDTTSMTYSLNMRVSRKSSKSKASKGTQDTTTNSSDIVDNESVKVMKELKFKRRRPTLSTSEANNSDDKKIDVGNLGAKDDGGSLEHLGPISLDDENARKPLEGVKGNQITRDRTSEDSVNSSTSASSHPHKTPSPIESVIPEGESNRKGDPTLIESSNSSPLPSPTTQGNNHNNKESLSRSSSIGSNKHSRCTSLDSEIIARKKSLVSKSRKLIKRAKRLSNSDFMVNDGSVVTGYAMANPKRNKEFHSFFKCIPHDEFLLNDYGCALQKEILAQGRIYVSLYHICFHANIFGWTTNLIMPFSEIVNIEKKMTAFVIPNAILITTAKSKYFFASFLSRDTAYEMFVKLWQSANPEAARKYSELPEYTEGTFTPTHQRESTYDSGNSASGSECVTENEKSLKSSRAKKFHIARLITRKSQNTVNSKEESSAIFKEHTSGSNDYEISPIQFDEKNINDSTSQNISRHSSKDSSSPKSMRKISFSSGYTQKNLVTQCECLSKNQHYDKVMMDTTFTGTIEKIYNLLCTSGFIAEFISKLENNDDTVFGEWTAAENGKLVRTASFTKRLNNSIGPKSTKCYLKEECLSVVMLLTTETPDVPSGGSFSVKTRTCIMWGGRNKVRVIVTAAVEFLKSTWLKGPIEKGAIEGQLEYYKALEIAVRKYISQNRSEFQEPEIEEVEDTDSEASTASPTKNHKLRSHSPSLVKNPSSSFISSRIISRSSSRNSSQFNLSYNTRNISQSNLLPSTNSFLHGRTSTEASSLIQFTTKAMLVTFTSSKSLLSSLFTIPNAKVISTWALIITIFVNACIWINLRDINVKIDKLQKDDILRHGFMAKEYGFRGRDGKIRGEWSGGKRGHYIYQDDRIFDADRDRFLEWLENDVAPKK